MYIPTQIPLLVYDFNSLTFVVTNGTKFGHQTPRQGQIFYTMCRGIKNSDFDTRNTSKQRKQKKNVSELYKQFLFGNFMVQGKQLSKALDAFTLVLS